MDLDTWITLHYKDLRRYASYICRGREEMAEELLQATLQAVYEGRFKIKLELYPLTYFQLALRRTLRELPSYYAVSYDNIDAFNSRGEGEQDEPFFHEAEYVEAIIRQYVTPPRTLQQRTLLYTCIPQLAKVQREVVEAFLGGMTVKEIAVARGRNEKAIRDALASAACKIRQKLNIKRPPQVVEKHQNET